MNNDKQDEETGRQRDILCSNSSEPIALGNLLPPLFFDNLVFVPPPSLIAVSTYIKPNRSLGGNSWVFKQLLQTSNVLNSLASDGVLLTSACQVRDD